MAMTLVMAKLPPSKRATGMAIFGLTATLRRRWPNAGRLPERAVWLAVDLLHQLGARPAADRRHALGLDKEKLECSGRKADWLGIFFMAMGLGSLTIFLEEGNSKDWFDSGFINTFAALAIVGMLGWVVTSATRKQPFVNLACTASATAAATALSAVMGMGLYGSAFMLPLFLGRSPAIRRCRSVK
jgi:DHA2 family multidrug resistance protein